MSKVLLTGMSGAGKTTLVNELSSRGHFAIDTEYDGWVLDDGTWDEARMDLLLAARANVIVSGTVENQGRFYGRFDHVILLSAPLSVLIERVQNRSNNPYSHSADQQAEIAAYFESVEPLLRAGASMELDASVSTAQLADAVENVVNEYGK